MSERPDQPLEYEPRPLKPMDPIDPWNVAALAIPAFCAFTMIAWWLRGMLYTYGFWR